MLTIDVEKNSEVAVVHCSGRLVRGVEVCTLRNSVISQKTTRIVVLASNPGRVHAVLPIDLPLPRTAALRDTPEFEARVLQVSHALRAALLQ